MSLPLDKKNLRCRDNRSTKHKCMEDQLSEQPTKILLPGEQNQSDHSAPRVCKRTSKRDM